MKIKKSDRLDSMRYWILFLVFFTSCQGGGYFSDLWSSWKDYTVTQIASQSAESYLGKNEREALLDLFDDLNQNISCDKRQELIEKNDTLYLFGKEYKQPHGYLFDILFNYDYESAFTKIDKTIEEKLAFTIVSVWKTIASIDQINRVVEEISKCYPKEYVN